MQKAIKYFEDALSWTEKNNFLRAIRDDSVALSKEITDLVKKMEKLEIGKKYIIHSYKHDSKIHRAWDEAVLLEIHEDYLIFGNEKTKVTESDGRTWHTKEPAVLYFFKNKCSILFTI